MNGKDIVYASLSGNMEEQVEKIIHAMKSTGVRRLIFISSVGI